MRRQSFGGILLFWGVVALASPAQAQHQRAFIPNENAGTVSVVNADTNAVEATIPLGGTPTATAVVPGDRIVALYAAGLDL